MEEQKWYLAGRRREGDAFQSETYDKYDFQEIKDFYLELRFPRQNNFFITHVSCLVEQSSSIGKAYITGELK